MHRVLLLVSMGLTLSAQTQIDLRTQAKNIDFSGASSTKPMAAGTSLPATCAVGAMFFKTDAPAGENLYGCTAPNVWNAQASLAIQNQGVIVGTRSAANFIAGVGVLNTVSDNGSQINIQSALDTAVVQTQPGEQSGGALLCASSGGSASQYTCSLSPTLAAYSGGMMLHWKPDVTNAGGATLNVDTLGAKAVKLADGVATPPAGTMLAGQLYSIWYDGGVFRIGGGVGASVGGGAQTWGQLLAGGTTWAQLLGGN